MAGHGANWVHLHHVAMAEFDVRVRQIPLDHWEASTPCDEWDVHDLVNHVTAENLWVAPLLDGRTIAEIGSAFEGDVLGVDPLDVWEESRLAALDAFDRADPERTVTLSFGQVPMLVYLQQRVMDLLVHAWDLAVGLGEDDTLDPDAVAAVLDAFLPMAAELAELPEYFEPPIEAPPGADLQRRMLNLFGREPD